MNKIKSIKVRASLMQPHMNRYEITVAYSNGHQGTMCLDDIQYCPPHQAVEYKLLDEEDPNSQVRVLTGKVTQPLWEGCVMDSVGNPYHWVKASSLEDLLEEAKKWLTSDKERPEGWDD